MAAAHDIVPIFASDGCKPVSTLVGVTALFEPELTIELEATAVASQRPGLERQRQARRLAVRSRSCKHALRARCPAVRTPDALECPPMTPFRHRHWLEAVLLLAALLTAACGGRTSRQEAPTRVVVNGVELHYVERGQGEPLILLHDELGDYRTWRPQFLALAPRYRVIAYSRRYHHPNDNPIAGGNHSALVDAEDLVGLVATLGLGPVHLVGSSYGAFTALAFAIAHPDQVRSLVLAEPTVHAWIAGEPPGAALREAFLSTVVEPAASAFARGDTSAALRLFVDALDGPGAFDRLPSDGRAAILANVRFFQALTASTDPYPDLSRDEARRLQMPVLVARGEDTDALHRLVTEEVGRVLRDARRVTVGWAGHRSPRQNPDSFNYAMLEFLGAGGRRK